MTGTPDRIRATVLALVVVVSMAAAPIAFGGSATAQPNNLKIQSTQPVAGNGTVTVTMEVADGANASFMIQDSAGTTSGVRTVRDDGPGDALNGTAGKVEVTLDLSTLFSATPASGGGTLYGDEGNTTSTSAPKSRSLEIDSSPPSVSVGDSGAISANAGEQIKIPYSLTDEPSSGSVSGTMRFVNESGSTVYQFSEGIQRTSSNTVQTTLPSDMPEGTYNVTFTGADAVGHTETDVWPDGVTVSSTSSATAANPQVLDDQPVKGTSTVMVSADLGASTGNNVTFAVEDGANVVSDTKTVTDGGPNDVDNSTDGTVTATLDLDALFGQTDITSDSQARLLVAGGDSLTVGNQDAKQQFALDAEPPTVIMLGSGSNTNPKPVYTKSGQVTTDEGTTTTATAEIGWNATDVPQKYQNYTLTITRHGETVATLNSSGLTPPISTNTDTVRVDDSWAEGAYNLSITIHDEVGYSATDTYSEGLIVDNTEPALIDAYLTSSTSSDTSGQMIVLDFADGPVDGDSVSAQDFNVTVDTRTLPQNATGVEVADLNVTSDHDVTIIPRLTGENLTEQTRSDWTFESPTVTLRSGSYIADTAGNQLQGPRTWDNITEGMGAPQDPDQLFVSPTPVPGDQIDSVTVSVNFTREESTDNGTVYVGDPPQQGTIHLRFTGPANNTAFRSMPTNTSDSLTEGTFDLSKTSLQDGEVQVMAKVVDEDGNTNPDGWDAPTYAEMSFPPAVTDIELSNAPIDAVEAETSQTVTVEFNEPMDTSTAPTVAVTGLNDSVSVTQSSYNNTTWTGTVDLPQNASTTATIAVSNATAADGAAMPETANTSFRIDSDRPQDPARVNITESSVNASEMGSVNVNATWDHEPGAQTATFRFTDGTDTATRTVNLSSPGVTIITNSTVVSTSVNLTNTGLNGSVTASAKATDGIGNVNPSGFTATSSSVDFQVDESSGGSGSGGDGSGGDGSGSTNLPAPSDVAVPSSPLNASESESVDVEVSFPEAPSGGNVSVTFADETTTLTHTASADTNATTTTVTVDISTENFTDGQLDVSARLVNDSAESAANTTAVLDTTGPTFADRTPSNGSTAGLGLDTISVDVSDAGVGVAPSELLVSIEDGDSDTTWDVEHATTNSSRVAYTNGTLTYTPGPSFEGGTVTVHVTARDDLGHLAETEWQFTAQTIEQVSVDAVEHDFVGVVREPDTTVTVSATATGATGSTIQSTSGDTFVLTLTRNGTQVNGTQSITADAAAGTIAFDLTDAITGTPEAGPVTVRVATQSGDAAGSTTLNLTHKVVAFDQTWELMGTPMPVETLHTSGVANFYSYSPNTGYESGVNVTEPGVGYYAERDANATTARVGYTFETVARTTLGNQTLEPGWNLVGATFDIDAANGVAIEKDLAPTQFGDAGVVVYTEQQGDLKLVSSGSTTVGEFDGYFVYVDSERTRVFAVESYQPSQDQQSMP